MVVALAGLIALLVAIFTDSTYAAISVVVLAVAGILLLLRDWRADHKRAADGDPADVPPDEPVDPAMSPRCSRRTSPATAAARRLTRARTDRSRERHSRVTLGVERNSGVTLAAEAPDLSDPPT